MARRGATSGAVDTFMPRRPSVTGVCNQTVSIPFSFCLHSAPILSPFCPSLPPPRYQSVPHSVPRAPSSLRVHTVHSFSTPSPGSVPTPSLVSHYHSVPTLSLNPSLTLSITTFPLYPWAPSPLRPHSVPIPLPLRPHFVPTPFPEPFPAQCKSSPIDAW